MAAASYFIEMVSDSKIRACLVVLLSLIFSIKRKLNTRFHKLVHRWLDVTTDLHLESLV